LNDNRLQIKFRVRRAAIAFSVLSLCLATSWATAQYIPGDPNRGQAIYEQHCVRCHGPTGKGDGPDAAFLIVPPANFQSPKSQLKSDLELLIVIAHGVVYSPMHGKRDILSDQEMWDVLQYVRTFAVYNVG
jgi:mono/diheme cytochrome c family protein